MEREIENWTQRSLALTNISNSKIDTRVRVARNTRKINVTEKENFPIPRLILRRNTVLPINQSFMVQPTISKFANLSSTLHLISKINAMHLTTKETTTPAVNIVTKSVTLPINTIGPALLVQEIPNEAPLLRTHDQ